MDPTPRHRAAERDFRQMLRTGGVAQPDHVDYAPGELVLRWSEQKLAVVVDLESPPDGAACAAHPEPARWAPRDPTGSAPRDPARSAPRDPARSPP